MFKSLAELKRFLLNNIGIEYTVKNYSWDVPALRKLSRVGANAFHGVVKDENHKYFGKEYRSNFPKASDIRYTERGFMILKNGNPFLEYTF